MGSRPRPRRGPDSLPRPWGGAHPYLWLHREARETANAVQLPQAGHFKVPHCWATGEPPGCASSLITTSQHSGAGPNTVQCFVWVCEWDSPSLSRWRELGTAGGSQRGHCQAGRPVARTWLPTVGGGPRRAALRRLGLWFSVAAGFHGRASPEHRGTWGASPSLFSSGHLQHLAQDTGSPTQRCGLQKGGVPSPGGGGADRLPWGA